MKRYWRIGFENPPGNTASDIANKTYELWRKAYDSQSLAEQEAERLARGNPGLRYCVYEVMSSYVVDGLTRELPDDLKAVAQEQVREGAQPTPDDEIPFRIPAVCGDSILIGLHTHTCLSHPGHPLPHTDGKKSWEPRDKPRLKDRTRVRTVKPPSESKDWTDEARRRRRWDVAGTVLGNHDSHGLYYDVRHDDDQSTAAYEPHELIDITGTT